MAIVPFFLPGQTIYRDRYISDYGTSSAVHALQRSNESNHRELMQAVKEMGANKLAVTVLASEIFPMAKEAFDHLDEPCRLYDKAYVEWSSRFYRVKTYLRGRRKRPEKNKKEKEIAEYRAKNLPKAMKKDVQRHVDNNSSWFRGLPYHEAYKLVEEGKCPTPNVDEVMAWEPKEDFNYYVSMMEHSLEMSELRMGAYGRSSPEKPDGYSMFPAIREVYEAANAAPSAMLTIPADTIRAIGKYAQVQVGQPKCPCCGSREFKYLPKRRICKFCRSEV